MDVDRIARLYKVRRRCVYAGYAAIVLCTLAFIQSSPLWLRSAQFAVLALGLVAIANISLYFLMYTMYRCLYCNRPFRSLVRCAASIDPFPFPERCPHCGQPVLPAAAFSKTLGSWGPWLLAGGVAAILWARYKHTHTPAPQHGAIPKVVGVGTWPAGERP